MPLFRVAERKEGDTVVQNYCVHRVIALPVAESSN